mmetsp:Transcript_55431/g.124884  ORF Transcript_55431/g.124884 Transcript_55431/m.124884 type:complete len:127 (+) Transcript_55431:79-459(+)|eukprot:CAMPEP_0197932152 /NCGR_PEP_ID=MMETSP1439-20131203/108155_1 /TAXON_ID=66791 /ORGANISM="Gonyaulax spinifera, Strain CCMP409" /LENGTH=126 /DNA_ID=CAMNT_0043554921 /DNA_START=65 /DNA_END=445 /DNA_ORIENTATION=-
MAARQFIILQILAAAVLPLVVLGNEAFLGLSADAVEKHEESLHDEMRSMMADDGADDDQMGGKRGQASMDSEYVEDSANSLSAALGPRWVGEKLEADAKEKTDALLKGIAGHKGLGSLNALLGALH